MKREKYEYMVRKSNSELEPGSREGRARTRVPRHGLQSPAERSPPTQEEQAPRAWRRPDALTHGH